MPPTLKYVAAPPTTREASPKGVWMESKATEPTARIGRMETGYGLRATGRDAAATRRALDYLSAVDFATLDFQRWTFNS